MPRHPDPEVDAMPRYLCDDCKYDYGDACRRPERPNALSCSDYVPRDALWRRPPDASSIKEFLDSLPVATTGDHPEIKEAARRRVYKLILAAGAAIGVVGVILVSMLR